MNVFINVTGLDQDAPHVSERISRMIRAAGDSLGVTGKEILGRRRTDRVARARHVAMWLVRTKTNLSLMEVGEAFGGKDHGTVIHACRNVEDWIAQGGALAVKIELLNQQFPKQ